MTRRRFSFSRPVVASVAVVALLNGGALGAMASDDVIASDVGTDDIARVFCAVGGGWAYYRSDANGWVRVGDAIHGCLF
jgi:hypothetical protein